MNRFLELFGKGKPAEWNKRVFLPVIHVKAGNELESGYRGAQVAMEAGADGAFLIAHSHQTSSTKLTNVVHDLRKQLTAKCMSFPIGVNYLAYGHEPDLPIYEAVRLGNIPMIWSDNTGGRPYVAGAREKVGWRGVYFGAVAFKYQTPVSLSELPSVAKEAEWMDVLTTSGESTGQAIDIEKARVFAEAVPDSIRAVASGVSIENVNELLPYFHAFLVSTSINKDFHTLDPQKTKELADAIHSWSASA